ncbi:hypothetical protein ACOSQ4_020448 [Xanthoceras sorbifolium]
MDQRLRLSPEFLKSHSLAGAVHNNIINFLPNRRCSSPSSPPPPLPPTSASFSNSPRVPAACFLAAPRRVSLVVLFAEENVKKNTEWEVLYNLRRLSLSTLISRHLPPLRRAGHLLHIFSLPSPSQYSYFPPLPSLLSSSPADSQLPPDVCFLAPPYLSSPRALLQLASSPVAAGSCCLLSRRAAFLRSSSSPENVKKNTIDYNDYLIVREWERLLPRLQTL